MTDQWMEKFGHLKYPPCPLCGSNEYTNWFYPESPCGTGTEPCETLWCGACNKCPLEDDEAE